MIVLVSFQYGVENTHSGTDAGPAEGELPPPDELGAIR